MTTEFGNGSSILTLKKRFGLRLAQGSLLTFCLMVPVTVGAADAGEVLTTPPVAYKTYTFTPGKLTGQEIFQEKENLRCRIFCFDQDRNFPKPKETVALPLSLRGGYRAHDLFGHDDFEPKEAPTVATGWLPQASGNFLIFPEQSKGQHLPTWIPERTRMIRVPLVKQYGDIVVNAYDVALGLDRFNKGDEKSISLPFQITDATDDSGKKGKRLVPTNPLVDGVYYAYSLPDDRDTANYGFLFVVGNPSSGPAARQHAQVSGAELQAIFDRHEEIGRAPDKLPRLQDTGLWPTVKDYALISQAVYKFGSVPNYTDKCPVDGMECFKDIQGSGFQAQVYVALAGKKIVVAFRGTEFDSSSDWMADVKSFFNMVPAQYEEAVNFLKQVVDKAKAHDYAIVVTGHSLGGGLAAYAALACEQRAVVFNAAGLGKGLRKKIIANLFEMSALVTTIDLRGDPVSSMGNQVGTVYTVEQPAKLREQIEAHSNAVGPIMATGDILDPHFIENVISGLEELKK